MNEDQIDEMFQKTIQIKGIEKKAGVTKYTIYNYRNRPRLSLGEKIVFLLKLDLIQIYPRLTPVPNYPEGGFNMPEEVIVAEMKIPEIIKKMLKNEPTPTTK